MQTIRTFLALEFGTHFKDEIGQVIQDLQPRRAKVKWVRPDQAHLTLHFFGNLTPDEVETVCQGLRGQTPRGLTPGVGLDRVGAFPNVRKPRVIWLGLGGDVAALQQIKSKVDAVVKQCGFTPEERRFDPHITLGRVKFLNHDEEFIDRLSAYEFHCNKTITIRDIILFKSTLTPKGPEYSVIEKFPL